MDLELPDFSQARVLVVGDVMLDRYWYGGTSRISPEAPVPVVHVNETEERPGGAGNVALNIRSLGGEVALVGLRGRDDSGQTVENKLTAAGVNHALIVLPDKPTITKLRVLCLHQQLIRLDFECDFHEVDAQPLLSKTLNLLADYDVLLLSDYGKGTLGCRQQLINAAHQRGIPILVDPKGNDFSVYKGATLLTPNLKEFEGIAGRSKDEADLVTKGLSLLEKYQLGALLITRGAQGMTLLRVGEPELHLPAHVREVYDVTGAGDTVISVLASSIAAGCDLQAATALANRAASLVVTKLGAASVSVPELRRAIQQDSARGRGVMTEEQLLVVVADAKAHGERIVMTNGCFDILHAGHVAYLEQAKALGARLIVAVNDDTSVARLKGDKRPINPLARRMAVLAGLMAVDWVVPFSEDTPLRIIQEISPDVLVKGEDYQVNEIVGYEHVISNGGEVKVLDFVEGLSSTKVIKQLHNEGGQTA